MFFDPTALVKPEVAITATVATTATNTADTDESVATVAKVAADHDQPYQTIEQALHLACIGLPIEPDEVRSLLSPEDIEDWHRGVIDTDTLTTFAQSQMQHRDMYQGRRPIHYVEHATCKQCGPIWLWFSGEVEGCPWCWNRVADRPIPRPQSVCCADCTHFNRIDHPNLGHCAKGEPEAIAGLWDTGRRHCTWYLPTPKARVNSEG